MSLLIQYHQSRQRGSSEKHPTLDTEMIITEVVKNLTPVFGQAQYKWRG